MNHGTDCKIVEVFTYAAGTTGTSVGATVDMEDFDSVEFVVGLGTLSSSNTTILQAHDGAAANGSDHAQMTDVNGNNILLPTSVQATDSGKILRLDVVRPQKRYVTPVLVLAAGNGVVAYGVAILYNAKAQPVAQDTSVSQAAVFVAGS